MSSMSMASLNLFSATGEWQQAPSPFFMTFKTQNAHCVVVIHPPIVAYTRIAYHTGSQTFLRKKFHPPNVIKSSASCSSFVSEYDGGTYDACPAVNDPDNKLWCSTKVDIYGNHDQSGVNFNNVLSTTFLYKSFWQLFSTYM